MTDQPVNPIEEAVRALRVSETTFSVLDTSEYGGAAAAYGHWGRVELCGPKWAVARVLKAAGAVEEDGKPAERVTVTMTGGEWEYPAEPETKP